MARNKNHSNTQTQSGTDIAKDEEDDQQLQP
jgi:hypothetical protein